MKYGHIVKGQFLERPNRFAARVRIGDREETVHVKNTGRCRELLQRDAVVYLEKSGSTQDTVVKGTADEGTADEEPAGGGTAGIGSKRAGHRTTAYDLVAVEKGERLINMDSQAPNKVFAEWMAASLGEELGLPRPTLLRPETTWGNSRFDFYWEYRRGKGRLCGGPEADRKGFVEVKGCTLEENGLALFPDAPTERGVKHLRELIACREAGFEAAVCVVIQMAGMTAFAPNDRTHPAFGAALREAAKAGVKVLAVECAAAPGSLTMTKPVPVKLYSQRT